MEPGELIEAAVRRETFEEAGVPVGAGRLPVEPALALSVQPDDRLPRRGARPARSTATPPSSRTPAGSAARTCWTALDGRDPLPPRPPRLDRPLPDRALARRPPRLKGPCAVRPLLLLLCLAPAFAAAQDVPEGLVTSLCLRRRRPPRRRLPQPARRRVLCRRRLRRPADPDEGGPDRLGRALPLARRLEARLARQGRPGLPRPRRRRRDDDRQGLHPTR